MSPSGPPAEARIPNTLLSSQSGYPQLTAVSHSALLKPGHPTDPSLVFSGLAAGTTPLITTVCHLWTLYSSLEIYTTNYASLKILGLRGQPSFNKGLTMEFCFLNLLSSQETVSTLGHMRTSSTPPLEGSQRVLGVRGSSLT